MPGKKISLDEIRSKYIAETDNLAKNLRFVLFSHPPGLGIGDDTYTKLAKNKIEITNLAWSGPSPETY